MSARLVTIPEYHSFLAAFLLAESGEAVQQCDVQELPRTDPPVPGARFTGRLGDDDIWIAPPSR